MTLKQIISLCTIPLDVLWQKKKGNLFACFLLFQWHFVPLIFFDFKGREAIFRANVVSPDCIYVALCEQILGPVHTGRRTPRNRHVQRKEHTGQWECSHSSQATSKCEQICGKSAYTSCVKRQNFSEGRGRVKCAQHSKILLSFQLWNNWNAPPSMWRARLLCTVPPGNDDLNYCTRNRQLVETTSDRTNVNGKKRFLNWKQEKRHKLSSTELVLC